VDEQDSMELTDHGFAVGTPAYMPPEQRISDPSLDHRADLYAWGTLAHETLTGRLPLPPEKAGEVDTGGVRAHRLELPESVARLVARCLATEPARRPANAEEIVVALEALGVPTTAATPGRSLSRVTVLAVAVVLSFGGFAVWRATRPAPPSAGSLPTPITVLGFINETGDPSLDPWGRMAGDWLTQGLQATGLVPVVPWPTALQASQLLQTQREAGRSVNPVSFLREETGAGTVVTGSYYLLGDSLQFRLEVADAVRGRVLGTIAPIMTSRSTPQAGIEAMRDRLMGMIAVWTEDKITHARQLEQRPPTFEAYQIFEAGAERFRNQDYAGAMTEYRRAFLADTEFVGALLSAGIASWNLGEAEADRFHRAGDPPPGVEAGRLPAIAARIARCTPGGRRRGRGHRAPKGVRRGSCVDGDIQPGGGEPLNGPSSGGARGVGDSRAGAGRHERLVLLLDSAHSRAPSDGRSRARAEGRRELRSGIRIVASGSR
jgi:hypothetical protein